jgi:hypothetical protein
MHRPVFSTCFFQWCSITYSPLSPRRHRVQRSQGLYRLHLPVKWLSNDLEHTSPSPSSRGDGDRNLLIFLTFLDAALRVRRPYPGPARRGICPFAAGLSSGLLQRLAQLPPRSPPSKSPATSLLNGSVTEAKRVPAPEAMPVAGRTCPAQTARLIRPVSASKPVTRSCTCR